MKTLIDEKGRLFGRINMLDLAVVLLIVAVLAGVGYKFAKSRVPTVFQPSKKMEVVFTADELLDFAVERLAVGDPVSDRVTGASFGKLKSFEIQPSISYATDSTGRFVRSSKETYRSLRMVVETEGTIDQGMVRIGNYDYYVAKSFEVRVGNTALWLRIADMKVIP